MATGAVKKVRAIAMPGTILAACVSQFNAMLAWADTHVHPAFPASPSVSANNTVKKVVDERGLGPKGVALTGVTTNTQSGRLVSGVGMSATEFTLVERIWFVLNAWRDLLDTHTHPATGASPSVSIQTAIVDENGRDPSGAVPSKTTIYRIRDFDMAPGAERDQVDELITQMNNFANWYDVHAHSASATAPNPLSGNTPAPVSKVGDLQGYDPSGALLTP